MRVTLKLFAMLADHLHSQADGNLRSGNELAVEIAEGTSVQAVIERFNLPSRLVHLVLVNGVYVAPQARPAQLLKAEDELAIWPPIAGG